MRIVYLVPGPISKGPLGAAELSRREAILQRWAPAEVKITVQEVPAGPGSIECAYEEFLSLAPTARLVADLERQDVNAVILGCFGDPGMDALCELTSQLVIVGPGTASFHLAAMLGESFGIVTVADGVVRPLRQLVTSTGLASRLAGITVVDTSVLELGDDPEATTTRAAEAAIKLVERSGADTIVLGCMSMAFLDLGPVIQAKIGVPVVNPVQAALMLAYGRASFGVRHSKAAYPMPRKMRAGASLADLFVS